MFFTKTSYSQNNFNIQFPTSEAERFEKCVECFRIFREKPKEVGFSVQQEGNQLFFQVNDKDWLLQLFNEPLDGLAVDIISKDRYDCDIYSIDRSQVRGTLIEPIYTQQIVSDIRQMGANSYRLPVGTIPDNLLDKEIEFNILFLTNNALCRYVTTYDLERYGWDLLDMGMYLDSLTFNPKEISTASRKGYIIKNKTLKFVVPFKKNISQYSNADIKPIYDSLQITDYNIKSIKIRAYASVEGTLKRNIELHKERANSILVALQSFQKPTIELEISSSENWVEFFNDTKGTKYDYFKDKSKNEIKAELRGSLLNELEPYLSKHRKAILELELEKKDNFIDLSSEELLSRFNKAVEEDDLPQAIALQNSIFERIKSKEISPDFLTRMEVPNQIKYLTILNKNYSMRYMYQETQMLIVYKQLLELEKIAPKSKELQYNITVLKIRLWRYKSIPIEESQLKNQILELTDNYGIDKTLVFRMMVNYHIIKAENLMPKRDYINKDKSVKYINDTYKKFPLSSFDYLSLAQFFSYYSNTGLAVVLLQDEVRRIDVDENLLFYYLNLTMVDNKLTQTSDYRTIMLNAYNLNPRRFCRIFNPVSDGGVTFQLLDDEFLRKTYCENCVNQN